MFEKYYTNQDIVPEGEWDEFMSTLRENLPSTFRITGFRSEAQEVLKILKEEFFPKLDGQEVDGVMLEAPKSIPWYPGEMAWQMNMARNFIRKSDSLKKFHSFLVSETESGNLSRQEAVSMIPPLLLDVQPHHKVLDMCAAPGSKTAQLIEFLHQDESQQIPEGMVVANDADNKRCYLMTHQVKRLQSPCFMIINHDASQLPNMRLTAPDEPRQLLDYDRVLADVPCSGDGTLRKNPDVWMKWNANAAHNLHGIQKRILKRGIEVLAVGGRVVYSTCSLNPIEDEAVIATTLKLCQGAVELVDVKDKLPGLKAMPAKSSWKVMSRSGEFFEKHADVPERLQTQLRESMFPPDEEHAKNMHLHRCLRILPHHQNTGGFFIAVLQKTKQVPWWKGPKTEVKQDTENKAKEEIKNFDNKEDSVSVDKPESQNDGTGISTEDKDKTKDATEGEEGGAKKTEDSEGGSKRKEPAQKDNSPPRKKQKMFGYKEDPFVFLKADDPLLDDVRKFYGLKETFPCDQLLVRTTEGKRRNIYLVSRTVKHLTENNEGKVKFVNMGLKVLCRSESKHVDCSFRIAQEGITVFHPFLEKRKIFVQKEDIITIMSHEYPFLSSMTQGTKEQLRAVQGGGGQGSVIYIYRPDGRPDSPQCQIILTGWLGKTSCRSFVPKNDRAHFLKLCGTELKERGNTDQDKILYGNKEGTSKEETEEITFEDEENKDESDSVKREIVENMHDIDEEADTVINKDSEITDVSLGGATESTLDSSVSSSDVNTDTTSMDTTEKDTEKETT